MANAVQSAAAPGPPAWGGLLRRLLATSFQRVSHARFNLHVHGLHHFTNRPGTLVVCNHQCDFDAVVLSPVLYWAFRGQGPVGRIAYVANDDMFLSCYAARHLLRGLGPLQRLANGLSLGPVFEAIRVYPLPLSRRRPLDHHLQTLLDVLGNVPLADVFEGPAANWVPGAHDATTLRQALAWRYRRHMAPPHSLSPFNRRARRLLREMQIHHIRDALQRFAALLDAGDAVFIAPEGGVTFRESIQPLLAGPYRLVHAARRDPTLLPVSLQYIQRPTGRPDLHIHIRPEQTGLKQLSMADLNRLILNGITPPRHPPT